jgi:hypothetical protein
MAPTPLELKGDEGDEPHYKHKRARDGRAIARVDISELRAGCVYHERRRDGHDEPDHRPGGRFHPRLAAPAVAVQEGLPNAESEEGRKCTD